MSKRYTDEYKNTLAKLYNSIKIPAKINSEYGLPKSTMSTWVKKWKPVAIDKNKTITHSDYQAINKKMARIEEENEILNSIKLANLDKAHKTHQKLKYRNIFISLKNANTYE